MRQRGRTMELGLRGRTAIVSAASRGLGRAVALALAREGANISMFSRNADAIRRAGDAVRTETEAEVIAMAADVTRANDLERVVRDTVARFGRVDILVNNAGGPPVGTFDTLSEEQWTAAVKLTLMSAVRLTRLVVPHMRAAGWGRIINMTRVAAREPVSNLMLSNSLRAAVVGWSKTLANELARDGILVNCVAPGRIDTERVRALDAVSAQTEGISAEEVRARQERTIPLGRYGTPEEFAAGVVFLASAAASYITGTTLYVDGGLLRATV
ncbi:MAG: SDR family oxidoreductase [Armatimonadota bacterium]